MYKAECIETMADKLLESYSGNILGMLKKQALIDIRDNLEDSLEDLGESTHQDVVTFIGDINIELQYRVWSKKLSNLDNHINSLPKWNGYAEECQRDYDRLLAANPRR